ncbi:MAG: EamA family transporter [Rhodospirillaceae bacterium]
MLAVSLPALALTLVCAIGFAASDYFRKAASDHMPATLLLTVFVTGQIPVIGGWVLVMGSFTLQQGYWTLGVITALAGLFANLLFLMALRVSSLSLTVPVLGLVPVFTTVFGALALNEIPTGQQTLGIVLAVLGLLTLYLPEDDLNPVHVFSRFATDTGARYMLGVAVLWSATAPLDKASMALSSPATHAFVQVCLISAALMVYIAVTGRTRAIAISRQALTPAALSSLTAGIAYGSQLVAYQLTLVGVVESLKRVIGLLSALLLGAILLHEPLTKPKLVGIALMIIGVPLIILPPLF